MKFSTGSSTMKQTVLVSSTQKNEAGAQSFPLRCGVTGFAGWSTGTFLIPVLFKKNGSEAASQGIQSRLICGKGVWPSFPPRPMVFSPCSS